MAIFIVGDTAKAKERIGKRLDNKNVVFLQGEFPYKVLHEIMDRLDAAAKSKLPVFQYIDSWYIGESENRIYVLLNRYEEGVINEFKEKVMDSPAILFTKSPGKVRFE